MVSTKRKALLSEKIRSAAILGIKKSTAKDLEFVPWIYDAKIKLRGIPFSFKNHEYLEEHGW